LGTECKWNLGGEFWYGGRKWRLWNIKTTYVEYKKWTMDGRSCGQHNIDFWSINDQ
jgi:hypothetical protein